MVFFTEETPAHLIPLCLNENSEITEAEQETASRKCLPHSLHSQGFCLLCNEKTMYINETKLPLLSVL